MGPSDARDGLRILWEVFRAVGRVEAFLDMSAGGLPGAGRTENWECTGRTTTLAPLLAASATFSPACLRFAVLSFPAPAPYQSPRPCSSEGRGELTSRQLDQRELARFLQWEGHGGRGGGSEGCGSGGEEAAEHSQVMADGGWR